MNRLALVLAWGRSCWGSGVGRGGTYLRLERPLGWRPGGGLYSSVGLPPLVCLELWGPLQFAGCLAWSFVAQRWALQDFVGLPFSR
jgi:hypothetical protein